jgi:hypothetical protein
MDQEIRFLFVVKLGFACTVLDISLFLFPFSNLETVVVNRSSDWGKEVGFGGKREAEGGGASGGVSSVCKIRWSKQSLLDGRVTYFVFIYSICQWWITT